jgi:hypothetical protein
MHGLDVYYVLTASSNIASFSSPFASGFARAACKNVSEDRKGFKKEDKSGRMNWEA